MPICPASRPHTSMVMTANAIQLVGSAFALVVLTGCVRVSLLCFALLMALWVGLFLSLPGAA